jgi:ubiquinone/menaquinone biosynthesis C-methylase UbiE
MTTLRTALSLLVTLLVPLAAAAQPGTPHSSEKVFEAIGVREGHTVCEIGAGGGAQTIAAARLVGPNGRVYTSELGEKRVAALTAAVAASDLTQITVVTGDVDKTNFPDAGCEALFMRDVYHHFSSPAPMIAAILAALKPGARVAVVDFRPPGEEAATPADRAKSGMHGVYPETVVAEMKNAGFDPVASEKGERWFMVVLSKPKGN